MSIWKDQSTAKSAPPAPEATPRADSALRVESTDDLPRRTTGVSPKESLIASDITIEGKIEGKIEDVFKSVIHRFGEGNIRPDGVPMHPAGA